MKTYEEMSEIVLARIQEEKVPLWKSILLAIFKHLITLVLAILIIVFLITLARLLHPDPVWITDCGG